MNRWIWQRLERAGGGSVDVVDASRRGAVGIEGRPEIAAGDGQNEGLRLADERSLMWTRENGTGRGVVRQRERLARRRASPAFHRQRVPAHRQTADEPQDGIRRPSGAEGAGNVAPVQADDQRLARLVAGIGDLNQDVATAHPVRPGRERPDGEAAVALAIVVSRGGLREEEVDPEDECEREGSAQESLHRDSPRDNCELQCRILMYLFFGNCRCAANRRLRDRTSPE